MRAPISLEVGQMEVIVTPEQAIDERPINPRLAAVEVIVREQIDIDDLRGQEMTEAAREATDRLMVEIHKLEESL